MLSIAQLLRIGTFGLAGQLGRLKGRGSECFEYLVPVCPFTSMLLAFFACALNLLVKIKELSIEGTSVPIMAA